MASRVVVVLYILLSLVVGLLLSLLPWVPGRFGLSDWGDNFFLIWLVQKTGFVGIKTIVSSGWIRGAVTGLGLLNLFNAFWEIAYFNEAVKDVESTTVARPAENKSDEPAPVDLSDIQRVDEK